LPDASTAVKTIGRGVVSTSTDGKLGETVPRLEERNERADRRALLRLDSQGQELDADAGRKLGSFDERELLKIVRIDIRTRPDRDDVRLLNRAPDDLNAPRMDDGTRVEQHGSSARVR